MMWLADNAWVAVALPALFALLVALVGRADRLVAPLLGIGSAASVLLSGIAVLLTVAEGRTPAAATIRWLPSEEGILAIGWSADGLVGSMLVVVGFVSLMVMVYSAGYMAADEGRVRYYALLSLFLAAMSLVVVSDGLLGLFIGWELMGVCSYLLIGHWTIKPAAAAAAKKAFLVTRVGDVGLLAGIVLLWSHAGALDYESLAAVIDTLSPDILTTVALLLAVGAIGKSAQFPLHIWLPDAMEGPTPVSALIHAATMVAAGVFLIARTWPIYELAPLATYVLLGIGVATALGAALVACVQTDIKRVLAFSTISQLGFMFAALGAGYWGVAMFHLVTHAAFKSLLFLAAGSVIHSSGTQDLRKMGGLRKGMQFTFEAWTFGALALAGIFPTSGFFSKDKILYIVTSENLPAGALLFLTTAITAYYVARVTVLVFFGPRNSRKKPHETGLAMSIPPLILAIPAVGLGYLAKPSIELMAAEYVGFDLPVALIATGVALLGVAIGVFLHRSGPSADIAFERRLGGVWGWIQAGYRLDSVVQKSVSRPSLGLARAAYRHIDRDLVDRAVIGVGSTANFLGERLRRLQNGDTQWYISMGFIGLIVLYSLSVSWDRIHVWLTGGG